MAPWLGSRDSITRGHLNYFLLSTDLVYPHRPIVAQFNPPFLCPWEIVFPLLQFYLDPSYFGCEDYYGKGLFVRMARGRDVIEQHRAKATIDQIEVFEELHLVGRDRGLPVLQFLHHIEIRSSSGSEHKSHRLLLC